MVGIVRNQGGQCDCSAWPFSKREVLMSWLRGQQFWALRSLAAWRPGHVRSGKSSFYRPSVGSQPIGQYCARDAEFLCPIRQALRATIKRNHVHLASIAKAI